MNISKSHDVIKNLKKLQDKNCMVDDLYVLSLLKKYNIKLEYFIYCDDIEYKNECIELIEHFKNTTKTYIVSKKTMSSLISKENCCYLLAVCELSLSNINEFKDNNFIVVCDKIEIPGNLGTIYRSCDAVGCDGIILVDAVTKLNNPKLVHSSRGMNIITKSAYSTFKETIDFLLENNFNIYVGEPVDGISYEELKYEGKTAIIVGSERYGTNPLWLDYNVNRVYIPMYGEITSLNVSIAASILMYEIKRKQN